MITLVISRKLFWNRGLFIRVHIYLLEKMLQSNYAYFLYEVKINSILVILIFFNNPPWENSIFSWGDDIWLWELSIFLHVERVIKVKEKLMYEHCTATYFKDDATYFEGDLFFFKYFCRDLLNIRSISFKIYGLFWRT